MGQITEWYYNYEFINLFVTDTGLTKYKVSIDGSLWDTLTSAKAHIDYLSK